MTDLLRLAAEAEKRDLPALSQLSADNIEHIWTDVSGYIESQMALQKGVHVAGLGTFTFSQLNLDLGNKSTMIQRPIFVLSGKLAHTLGLKQTRPLAAATHLPVVPLNFTAVSQGTAFSRDRVEGCVRETLLLLVRILASQQNVLLVFPGIGVLTFKNNKVQMKFSTDFIKAMDGTGSLLLAFKQRPGSSASLTSAGSRQQRPQTVNFNTVLSVHSPELQSQPADCSGQLDQIHVAGISQQSELKSHWPLKAAKISEVNPKPHEERHKDVQCLSRRPLTSPIETLPKMADPRVSCSGHTRAGQELCYLCMQRAKRNVPVYLREQEEAEERSLEKLLLLRALHKDRLFYEKEQAKLAEQREYAREVASFNLSMSKKDVHSPRCPTSFIFPSRPLTPAPRIKQCRYRSELQTQINRKQQHDAKEKKKREMSERQEQVQLRQELASFRTQQLREKRETTANYRKALDLQASGVPVFQPHDVHVTGSENAEHVHQSHKRAVELFQANSRTAIKKKQDELEERQTQVAKEQEILRQNRVELVLDQVNRFEKRRDMSRFLENDWSQSVKLKQQREEEERRFLRSAGQLLVDKLVEYRRCAQCKRNTSNCGQSNIWRDCQHLSGSQFMS